MASTSKQAPSSSYSPPQWTYDVFFSFRGKDTRNTFTGHLYANLKQRGIDVYMDDRELERGKTIEPALWKAIEESRFSVVIFSRDYASSPWCLDELVKIVQCMKEMGQTVFPVFFDVDPSEVAEQQKGNYKKAFAEHEKTFMKKKFRKDSRKNLEKMHRWKDCLASVANLSGWDIRNRNESEMMKIIVEYIVYKLSITLPTISKNLVGLGSRLEILNGYICEEASDTIFIGICGMGGIGKTTVARVIYDRVRWRFEGSCFLANVREVFAEKDGALRLQKQLLSEILMECATVWDSSRGIDLIKRRLRHKKVLLILDDVDEPEQLEILAGGCGWFGLGSRIIITSRNTNVLDRHGVTRIYEAEKLNDDDALMLFSWKAFTKDQPKKDFMKLSKRVVAYANGLPLALEVIGSFLHGRGIIEWESAINRLNEIPDRKITEVLRISFDGLHALEKKIFLDIACFFKGMKKDRIISILNACGFHASIGIQVLLEKSLINVSRDEVWMHNLLQEMGEETVCSESPEEPKKRSRLWTYKDVCVALKDFDKENEKIESIFLDMPGIEEAQWNMKAFAQMSKLRLLKIHNVHLSEGPEHLTDELRFFEWHAYPSKSLPACFKPDKLVELDLYASSIQQLWYGLKISVNLKTINLSYSLNLIETPDFTGIPNLERLILEGCTSLSHVHPSLGCHKKLQYMNLVNCQSLESIPCILEMESLKVCTLVGCSKLKKFPGIESTMNCLMELRLDGTCIAELSSSICHLVGLIILSMTDCKNLESIPTSITGLKSLKKLDLSGCSQLKDLPKNLGKVESLEELDASGTSIRQPPASIFLLKNLKALSFDGCKFKDQWLSSFSCMYSLEVLDLRACNLGEGALPQDIGCLSLLKVLDLSSNMFISLPESINQLCRLEKLALEDCRMLKSLPDVPSKIQTVNLNGCISLARVPDPSKLCSSDSSTLECLNCWDLYKHNVFGSFGLIMLQRYLEVMPHLRPGFGICAPGSNIPRWFSHHSEGSTITVNVPPKLVDDGGDSEWIGFAACIAFSADDHESLSLSCYFRASGTEYYPLPMYIFCNSIQVLSDHLWLFYLSFDHLKELQEWKHESFSNTELSFHFCEKGVKVKSRGVCLVKSPTISPSSESSSGHLIVATKGKESASSSIASLPSYFCHWIHDVFSSFGAEDTSNNFIPYLYATALIQRAIFCEEMEVEREKAIDPRLLKAIEESWLSIIIFTGDHDCASRSVDKLLHIIRYANHMKNAVFPVSRSLSNESKGSFTIIFDKDGDDSSQKRDKVERWMNILNKSSWVLQKRGPPCDLPDERESMQLGPMVERNLVGQAMEENKDLICSWLMNDVVASIGIYGMAGVGKTALATCIHNELLKRHRIFSDVYWITVTGDGDTYLLQNLIAKEIGLGLSSEIYEEIRAAELYEALIRRQKSVLILDNVQYPFSLKRVGIPVGVNGCKLVFTTRSFDVCQSMDCHEKIKVEPLSEKEAWTLFMETLQLIEFPPKLEQIAKSIVWECAGLPIAILTMAGSMREVNDMSEWRNALEELKESKVRYGYTKPEVFSILRLGYIRLKDSASKQCLAHCALFPQDYPIQKENLIEYLVYKGITGMWSMQKAYDEGLTVLNKLGNACLLECYTVRPRMLNHVQCVKAHGLIREMVLDLGEEFPFMAEARRQLEDLV